MIIKIGSRGSRLAVAQSNIVINAIKKIYTEIEFELVLLKTTGDRILDKRLDKIGGKGLFTKELDEALESGEIDLAVHSMKDLPIDIPKHLPILAVSKREDPRDVLILPRSFENIDFNKPIGSSSLRRTAQFTELYKNAKVESIRGNVETRIRKLDEGQYSAIILAMAGIKRLDLTDRISYIFSTKEMLPAACQGIICVQGREDLKYDFLSAFNNKNSYICSQAERAFIENLSVGCSAPVGAYAEIFDSICKLRVMALDKSDQIIKIEQSMPIEKAKQLGLTLGQKIKNLKGI